MAAVLAVMAATGPVTAAPAPMSPEGKKAHDEAVGKAIDDFKKAVADGKGDNERATAILKLGQSERDLRIVGAVAPHLLADGDLARHEAIGVLKVYRRERAAGQALLAALPACKGKPTQLERLVAALGEVGIEEAVPALVEQIKSANKKVAAAAAKALGETGGAAVVDPLVKALRRLEADRGAYQLPTGGISNEGQERFAAIAPAALEALAAVTGQKLSNAAEYEEWWKKGQGTFKGKAEEAGSWRCTEHK
jgi:hypothetical protein